MIEKEGNLNRGQQLEENICVPDTLASNPICNNESDPENNNSEYGEEELNHFLNLICSGRIFKGTEGISIKEIPDHFPELEKSLQEFLIQKHYEIRKTLGDNKTNIRADNLSTFILFSNQKLINYLVKRHKDFLSLDESIAICNEKIFRALKKNKFNPYLGNQFSTYIGKITRNALARAKAKVINIDYRDLSIYIQIQNSILEESTSLTDLKIQKFLLQQGFSKKQIDKYFSDRKFLYPINLDTYAGNPLIFKDFIQNQNTYEDKNCNTETLLKLLNLEDLTEKDLFTIILYYGLLDGTTHTQKEIGKIFGVKRQTIQQQLQKIYIKLKPYAEIIKNNENNPYPLTQSAQSKLSKLNHRDPEKTLKKAKMKLLAKYPNLNTKINTSTIS